MDQTQKTNLVLIRIVDPQLCTLAAALPSSWKVLPLPAPPHPHPQILPILQSWLNSHFLFEIFSNHSSWTWSSPPERYNSAYCLCTHVVHINSYFRIRKSLREIIGNPEVYSFMCNSFILSFVCNWAPSIAFDAGDSKMNQVLSWWSPQLARWGGRLHKSL